MDRSPSWARVSAPRLEHVRRVVRLLDEWAGAMAVSAAERERWLRAAWLHDALRDAPEAELRSLAPDVEGPVDLLHGPAAAARAAALGETDAGVLSAVRWHSIGSPLWDRVGQALYCADFLEPGRSFEPAARAALAARYPADPDGVLREVARWRLGWLVRSGWSIPESTWRFWNHLAGTHS